MAVVHYLQVKKKRISKSEIHDSARLILISPVCDSQAVCWSRTGLPGSPTDTWWAHRSLVGGCKVLPPLCHGFMMLYFYFQVCRQ